MWRPHSPDLEVMQWYMLLFQYPQRFILGVLWLMRYEDLLPEAGVVTRPCVIPVCLGQIGEAGHRVHRGSRSLESSVGIVPESITEQASARDVLNSILTLNQGFL